MSEQNEIDFDKYLAWLEGQKWVWQQQEGQLVFFADDGPHEYVETEPGQWAEMEAGHDDPNDDFTGITDPRLIAILNAKKKELQPE
jgi:hypothetical protein